MVTHLTNQLPTGHDDEFQRLVDFEDLVIRGLRNSKLPDVQLRLYLALCDTYPQLLTGEEADIQLWRIRENAGWPSERSVTNFFQDLANAQAFIYDAGKYERKLEQRVGHVTPLPDFGAVEIFDTKSSDRKRKAREAEEKRRKQFINPRQIVQCEECGGHNLVWDATARCLDCKHIHEPYTDIPASMITIQAEIIEVQDDIARFDTFLDDQPTAKLVAVRPIQQTFNVTPAPQPARVPPRPDETCINCGRLRRDCFTLQEGSWWYSCTPDMWSARK